MKHYLSLIVIQDCLQNATIKKTVIRKVIDDESIY